ncbi:3-isopropylmalate dehydratase small subunit [Prevotella histicola]|jgi:3-isopropylmalate dehydratase, small subunit|uniref:3-isopropylmalate dehydratase small subunit n=1 Tax=Prevotella histicola F0411 TaxID=857291 RepID=G6AEK3_9BACT|nr:3-isopropylmalate dehydratase small subunit [Prevotella histicola]MBF1733695.1 3-isopropylmalate dehydratase small subunit [Veillonella dispar]EHG17202.1 3-isopropylmalate dehydratase small subunit [Prevotella histicola F0411]MBF1391717.1 3-isopropylmalate dehydratase small subunit [Prevotella histicola]MBF1397643.1 3-isopropylmalate dehydratase small subunit [Prevotella histicola]MBF1399211.1 3-isopropylmalate dehydratase small subunit [Prevotella histicola]
MKQKFNIIKSTCVPLPLENIDTDQIIPARFLKATDKQGFGDNLFRDWRYDKNNQPIKDFVLNDPKYGGCILVAGRNFGSGSSREHAAWAIAGYGFRVVISSFFADIHKNNELNNFVLPVVVSEGFLKRLFDSISDNPKMTVTVDLPHQTVINEATGEQESFEINGYKKHCLMNGLDDVDFLVQNRKCVEAYEARRK